MKKIVLLFTLVAAICYHSFSQPTITASGFNAVIGDIYYQNVTAYVSPGAAGANETWDLTGMVATQTAQVTVVAPSSTANGSSFPNSNIALTYSTSTSVSYLHTGSNAFQNCGAVNNSGVVVAYSNPEDIIHFPSTFSSTFADSWATQFSYSGYNFYRKGTTTVIADGYGTLITPTGVFTEVMRYHMTQTYSDSANVAGSPYIIDYTNDQYFWCKEGKHYFLATVFTLTNSVTGTTTSGTFTSATSDVEPSQEIINSLNLYPNPASNLVSISYQLEKNQEVEISILNALGQSTNISKMVDAISGENVIEFDIHALTKGIYYVQVRTNGNEITTKKLIVL
jgi:hypothetical protein